MGELTKTRPAPTASGSLAKTPFAHLLLYALDRKLRGTIELFSPDKRTATVVFDGGEPTKLRTSEHVLYLGEALRELGFLDQGELDRSLTDLAKQKASGGARLHGALLVSMGIIDAMKLRAGLTEQLARKLRYVAALSPETAFAYYDGFDALHAWGGDDSPRIDPVPQLWSMLREYTPWDHVNAALARVAPSFLRLSRAADVRRLGLADAESAAVELLRESPLRAVELAKAAHLNERTANVLMYLLLLTKQVDVLKADGAPRSVPAPAGAPPSGSPISIVPGRLSSPPVAAPRMPSSPPPSLSAELAARWKEIVERAATIDRADYFGMLDLARDATRDEVESAFLQLAKRWHPDKLPADLAPVREACSRVFARMSEARANLVDDQQRARYMTLLAEGSGTPETQETVAKVIEAAQNFQKAEVYFKRNDLAQAESFCKLALDADDTQPDYLALYAWLGALKPENQSPERTAASIKQLDRAIGMNARCEKALYWRGMLYKRIGKVDLASKDFRKVADINPRNIDAAREVRLHQMRAGRPSAPPPPTGDRTSSVPSKADDASKGGLFGRLFKK